MLWVSESVFQCEAVVASCRIGLEMEDPISPGLEMKRQMSGDFV